MIRVIGRPIRDNPTTLVVLGVLILVYTCQLALAGSIRSGAGYDIANSLSAFSYIVLNPWLHSDHLHLLENAIVFAVLGWWTERRTDSSQFAVFVFLTGYITNLIPPLFGDGFGVGASGITNGLWAFFVATQLYAYQSEIQGESLDTLQVGKHLFLSFIGLIFVLRAIAEFGGFMSPPAGTAIGSHFVGIVLGFGWFGYRLIQ